MTCLNIGILPNPIRASFSSFFVLESKGNKQSGVQEICTPPKCYKKKKKKKKKKCCAIEYQFNHCHSSEIHCLQYIILIQSIQT